MTKPLLRTLFHFAICGFVLAVAPRASASTAMIFCNGNMGSASGLTTGIFYDVTLTNRVSSGNLVLNWIGNGRLLEATNLLGPWTTNLGTSPVTITPNQPQMFYRIQTQ